MVSVTMFEVNFSLHVYRKIPNKNVWVLQMLVVASALGELFLAFDPSSLKKTIAQTISFIGFLLSLFSSLALPHFLVIDLSVES